MKTCKKCQIEKQLDAFSNYSASEDGKRPYCRECMNAHNRVYMKTPKGREVHKGTNKRYYSTEKGKEQRRKDGSKWRERPCYKNGSRREYKKRYSQTEKAKQQRYQDYIRTISLYPEKYIARYKLRNAVANGTIIKKDVCEKCSSNQNIQGHHEDYTKPLDVIWLCKDCHIQHHVEGGLWKRK